MKEQYWNWVYYGAGIFMGFYDALNIQFDEPTTLWHGAAIAVGTVVVLWLITWIFCGFKKANP